jgi:nucleotide-binding universal stress UspA family protein
VRSSIFLALKDSLTSRAVVNYVANLPLKREDVRLTLLHVMRQASQSESLVEGDSVENERLRVLRFLEEVRNELENKGFRKEDVEVKVVAVPYPTATEGIVELCTAGECDLLVIGRKRMSKAQEFVMGDISIKLVRAMQNTGILVVESP